MKTYGFESIASSLGRIIKGVQTIKSRKMAQYGLKGTTCACICYLYNREEGLNAAELAQLAEIDKAQISRCTTELVEKGFIYREEREGRCYKQKYRLTKEGEAIARDIVQTIERLKLMVSEGISEEELQLFQSVLRRLEGNFSGVLDGALDAENE